MLPSAVFTEEGCKDLSTATHRDSKLPSPTCCKLCNQPSPRSTQEKRHEPSPVALHAPAYMTWFPHQDHNSCKVMRHHAQASIIFDSNHLQTSQRPSVNPADLLHSWFSAAHRNISKNTTSTFVHSLIVTLLRELENKMGPAISFPL